MYEPELEQGDADWKPRKRSRGALDDRRQSRRDVLAGDESFVERRVRYEAGEDGMAPLRGVEHEELAAGGHRREVREEGRQALRRRTHRIPPVAGQGWPDAVFDRDQRPRADHARRRQWRRGPLRRGVWQGGGPRGPGPRRGRPP